MAGTYGATETGYGRSGQAQPAIGYRLRGRFLEACDCEVLCPCWVGQPPDSGECSGLFAWDIEDGEVAGRPVPGCRVVSVSHHEGERGGARQKVAVFVDGPTDVLTDEVASDLVRVFSGQAGGPLGALGGLLGELVNAPDGDGSKVRREISLDYGRHGRVDLSVRQGQRSETQTSVEPLLGERRQPIEIGESALSLTLGAPATVAKAETDAHRPRRRRRGGLLAGPGAARA